MSDVAVQKLLDKALLSIRAADLLFAEGLTDFAAGRAYYAMFYAVEALLLKDGHSYSKHSAVVSAFGRDYVKTGTFDKKYHEYFLDAYDLRNIGDYGILHAVDRDSVAEIIRKAGEMVEAVREHVRKRA